MKKLFYAVAVIGIVSLLFSTYLKAQTATIDLTSENQYIRGFGGMNMPDWIQDLTANQVDKAFGNQPGQIGLSILRIKVPSDSTFEQQVPAAARAKLNGAIIMASPWSPPASMKTNNSTTDGSLKTSSYADYASYLKDFIDSMDAHGAPLYAISVQNEPDVTVTYESCDWTPGQMLDFVSGYISGPDPVKLIVSESFNFNQSQTDSILNDPVAESKIGIIGGHIYGGGLSDYPLAEEKGKEVWMTEHLADNSNWEGALATGQEIHNCMVENFNAYIWFYIRKSYGFLQENGNISKRGYVMSQYSKFVRPGFTRVDAITASAPNIDVTAYKTDTSVVIVAINRNATSDTMQFTLQNGTASVFTKFTTSATKNIQNEGTIDVTGDTFTGTLDAQSITTFTTYAGNGGSSSNIAPVANAGSDATYTDSDTTGDEEITLDGSASSDPDGTITNYTWSENGNEIASGEDPIILIKTGVHTIILAVTDNDGAIHTDSVTITINLASGITETNIWLEAECATIGSIWRISSNSNASNGEVVNVQAGNNSTDNASESISDQISYTFNVTQAGIYTVWARTIVPSPDDDSFWVRMDNGTWVKWNSIRGGANLQWDYVFDSDNGSQIMSYDLTPGSHTLTIAYREDGAVLDKLYITNTGNIPSGSGDEATNCSGITNYAPFANAGTNIITTDSDNDGSETIQLRGVGSSDIDGSVTGYTWYENTAQIATGISPSVSLSVGIHNIVLIVMDNEGATDGDTVIVTVNGISNLNHISTGKFNINVHPNPITGQSAIEFTLEKTAYVYLELFDITGRSVITLVNGIQKAGKNELIIDGNNLKNGIYLLQFRAGHSCQTKRIVVNK